MTAMPNQLMLNRAHHPVTTLGPGVRAGIWTQGCAIGCHGCASQDTWQPDDERRVPAQALVGWLDTLSPLDGLTITGGEPFQQVEALTAVLRAVRSWAAASRDQPFDILVYSGYTFAALGRRTGTAAALALCDAVITGPYIDRLNPGGRWRGSANQKLVLLSPLGHDRFEEAAVADADAGQPDRVDGRMQASSDGDRMWLIGIPGPGDLQRLEHSLQTRGVDLGGTSWNG